MPSLILFLCARVSARSLLAASILADKSAGQWDIWSTSAHDQFDKQIVFQVLQERGIVPLSSDHLTPALFGCTGMRALFCAAEVPLPDHSFLVLVGIAYGQSKTRQIIVFPRKNSVRYTVALPKRLKYKFEQNSSFLHVLLFCYAINKSLAHP